jgi:hypothetical protein
MSPVRFKTKVQRSGRRFSVPKDVCRRLKVHCGDKVDLVVRNTSGQLLFSGRKMLKSGAEIYGARDIGKHIRVGQRIRVSVSKRK